MQLAGYLAVISSYWLSLCSSLQRASCLIPVEFFFLVGGGANCCSGFPQCPPLLQVTGHIWLRNRLPALLLVFWHVGAMGSRPGIEAQGCPSACSTGRMCFRNPATRASSGRAPGVKDPGRGRLQRTGTLGAGRGGNPDSHSPLPLTSVNCHSYSFLHFSPQKFCFRSSFPRGNVEGKSLSFDPFWTQLST